MIVTPKKFRSQLYPLVEHKEKFGVNTRLVTLDEIYKEMYWSGRDNQEKIKYFIKNAIENWGITHVLLVGGLKGQSFTWDMPVRYSRVVPTGEQEYDEQTFISDIYYADIYNSTGSFSSWDSNNDDFFSVWNGTFKDEIDLYPDVYLGRLACRTVNEVKTMVRKIINYEQEKCSNDWFNNLIIVAGDSYNDPDHFNEGELIGEKAIELAPNFEDAKKYRDMIKSNEKGFLILLRAVLK